MKYFNNVKQFAFFAVAALVVTSCKKVKVVDPLGDGGQKIIGFVGYGGLGSNFTTNSNLAVDHSITSFPLDLQLVYSTPSVSSTDILATVVVDTAAVTSYNATITDPTKQYAILPASTYTFVTKAVKIAAGQTISETFQIIFNPSLIDPAVNYMLPLSVTTISGAGGINKAPGTGTAYLHFIGNPLAGKYTMVGIRYAYTAGVAGASGTFDGSNPANIPATYISTLLQNTDKTATAVDGNTISIDFGNLGSSSNYKYLITQKNSFTAITPGFNPDFLAGNSAINVWVASYTAPNPVTHVKAKFRIITQYNNAAAGAGGSDRIWDEQFTQQ